MSHPIQEEDRIATPKIVLTAIVSLFIFGVGVVWAVSIQRSESNTITQQPPPYGPAIAGAPEVGIVYQWPFYSSHYGADKVEEKRALLDSYGWVDKGAKVVHIPIDQAMERYVSQSGAAK